MGSYDTLRSIGVSVETADAIAPIIDELPAKKREAFILWAMDVPERLIIEITKISKGSLYRLLKYVRGKSL